MCFDIQTSRWSIAAICTSYIRQSLHITRVSCQRVPTRHAYAWQRGPFWPDTLELRYTCSHTILVCKLSEHISTQLKPQRYLNTYYIQNKWVILACTGYPWEVERQRVSFCKSLGGNAVLVRHNATKNVFMINFVDESGYVFPHFPQGCRVDYNNH